jgi:hypothetical protein
VAATGARPHTCMSQCQCCSRPADATTDLATAARAPVVMDTGTKTEEAAAKDDPRARLRGAADDDTQQTHPAELQPEPEPEPDLGSAGGSEMEPEEEGSGAEPKPEPEPEQLRAGEVTRASTAGLSSGDGGPAPDPLELWVETLHRVAANRPKLCPARQSTIRINVARVAVEGAWPTETLPPPGILLRAWVLHCRRSPRGISIEPVDVTAQPLENVPPAPAPAAPAPAGPAGVGETTGEDMALKARMSYGHETVLTANEQTWVMVATGALNHSAAMKSGSGSYHHPPGTSPHHSECLLLVIMICASRCDHATTCAVVHGEAG